MVQDILIIQTAFLGDVVLALPLTQVIREAHPDARIHFLVRKGAENLLSGHPAINLVHVWDKSRKYRSWWSVYRSLSKYSFSAIYNLHRHASSGLLTCLLTAEYKTGFDKNPFAKCYDLSVPHCIQYSDQEIFEHEVQRNLSLFVVNPPTVRPALYFDTSEERKVASYRPEGEYVVICPASVWYTKQFPVNRWRELITALPEQITICLCGGPGDRALLDSCMVKGRNILNLGGKLSLKETALLMRDARRVYANDSAPLHLASAVNAPVTAFFLSTSPAFGFGPLSDDREILEVKNLDCRPCGLHGHRECPRGHFRCAQDIHFSDKCLLKNI